MPKRTEAYLDDRRRRLLKAAERCFLRKGYHATSIGDICKAADVSIGTIYKYFPGKREIFIATHEDSWERALAELSFESWPDLRRRYVELARTLDSAKQKATTRITLELSSEALFDAELVRMSRPQSSRLHGLLTEQLERMAARGEIGLPLGVASTVRMMQSLMTGVCAARPWFDIESPAPLADDLERLLDMIVQAKSSS